MARHLFSALLLILLALVSVLLASSALADEKQDHKLPPSHHLVKIKPPASMKIPETFPLNERGEIDCETCHGIEGIATKPFDEVDRKAPGFHRGGPYENLSDFCYRCHEKRGYERPNVHQLLDEQGKYDKQACEYCHQEAPDPKRDYSGEELKLRLPLQTICLGCHLKTPHLNALNHLRKADKKMRQRIAAQAKKLGVIFPLDSEGKVTCVTCHAPHQKGVIDPRKAAGRQVEETTLKEGIVYRDHPWNAVFVEDKKERLEHWFETYGEAAPALRYRRIEKEVLLRLPAKNGQLCLACHQFER